MRRRLVLAASAVVAILALVGLPESGGSRASAVDGAPADNVFTAMARTATTVPTQEPQSLPPDTTLDVAARSAGFLDASTPLVEAVTGPAVPSARPKARLATLAAVRTWKPPRQTLTGYATFYDNGTTAMRLPRGTSVVICGKGGCIERVVNDYGPVKKIRVVDMYRPDFFGICGCGPWAGTTLVTVWVY
jgi:hypothetical protein